MIPYGKQSIDEEDIQAVIEVLRSNWLTTGPKVDDFEQALAEFVEAKYAVAVNSGTAALHCAMYALGIGPGDEVIVPAMTFAATANCVVFQGGTPIFVDVDPDTLLINPQQVELKINSNTRAVIAVDYAGQPCDYEALQELCDRRGLALVGDSCHALGAEYKHRKIGRLADMTVFSFHPVKHITTGEGGMITTDQLEFAERLRLFRNHGISTSYRQREERKSWFYEMVDIGYNYRITDIQSALGCAQLKKLPRFIERRREIAKQYDEALEETPGISPIKVREDVLHSYHLYVIKLGDGLDRAEQFRHLLDLGIGVNVHYIPVHLHPFYRKRYDTGRGLCPNAEEAYEKIMSLPIYPAMTDSDIGRIIEAVSEIATRPSSLG